MGYNKETARVALKMCNNVIADSIQYIQDNPCPGPSQSKSMEFLSLVEDLVPQVIVYLGKLVEMYNPLFIVG